jgi:NADP-dependent 3-hydroxy acid dehydrogenase YdfG
VNSLGRRRWFRYASGMSKTILINGYGTGISAALSDKFAAEGFSIGLVARSAERLEQAAKSLQGRGVRAAALPGDLADPASIKAVVAAAKQALGPIDVVQWNAYAPGAGDLLGSDPRELSGVLGVAVIGLSAMVQECLPDLRARKGAVLVTNGGLGLLDTKVDAMAVQWNAMGLAVANAAKHKLMRLLAEKVRSDGVYVGEVMVLSAVKGTAWDNGSSTLEAAAVADKFWQIYSERRELSVMIG